MQIGTVGQGNSYYGLQKTTSLTSDQTNTAKEIISGYDLENISREGFEELMTELRESGIPNCKELRKMISDAGFTPAPPPEAPSELESTDEESEQIETLLEILEKAKNGEITEDERKAEIKKLMSQFLCSMGNLVNIEA